ncbi:MAG: (2Fe-2S)-binding protein [Candidatus Omnitrophica bacterium]|nr:(2Fe-2S)-binding protein [Candidatus Omnitrophota bacterium]MDE2009595.1 (2Fe-2S)-binding protein [Candidatus Omnitrophota bacterium]MDE2231617.1 (2Fe-2S)-binding protein [Candidatus Omnitrophota bacterium]
MNVNLTINKKQYSLDLKGHETLLEVLRDRLSLTGTKTACQETECGTCTVIINGKAVLSCITLAVNVQGDDITTIEGLADGDVLHPVQQAFVDCGSVQCGFCIPGMIMSSVALLEKNPEPTQEQIEYALDGNICRCAGYPKIFEAVREAGKKMKNKNGPDR